MPASLLQYEMLSTTWVFVSALMTIAVFVKFNRLWSVRNLDLIGLILFGVGLLYLAMNETQPAFRWLLGVSLLMGVRMIFDTIMVRRPLLEPNLTTGGLSFACVALFAFLVAAAVVNRGDRVDSVRTVRLDQILTTRAEGIVSPVVLPAPGLPIFHHWVGEINEALVPSPSVRAEVICESAKVTAKVTTEETVETTADATTEVTLTPAAPLPLALTLSQIVGIVTVLLSHAMIVVGLIVVGARHFGSLNTGIACATLYLLLPYTHQMIGRLDHFLPAALLTWSVVAYRRPMVSGLLITLAGGLVVYPIFLLSVWGSFYWRCGLYRFISGVAIGCVVVATLLAFSPSPDAHPLSIFVAAPFTGALTAGMDGIWKELNPVYWIPMFMAFTALWAVTMVWPAHKHLATLLCCSTLLLLAAGFLQPHEGGLTLAWSLPTMILTFFRPNLEDRTAEAMVPGRRSVTLPPAL